MSVQPDPDLQNATAKVERRATAPAARRAAKVIPLGAFRPSDGQLLARVIASDSLAQQQLYSRYCGYVEALLHHILGQRSDIPDVLQDVFLQVFHNIDRVREPAALKGWIRAVTVACARQFIRRRSRRRWLRFLPDEELPELPADEVDDDAEAAVRATYQVLEKMSADLRIAFSLRHIEQLELTAVADACGVSLATIKRRIHKANELFAAHARRNPALIEWVSEGSRWREK